MNTILSRYSNNNQSAFSFNVNSHQNNEESKSKEELKQIIERKVKEIYDQKIPLLEKSIQDVNEKIFKDNLEYLRVNREKNEKIENLSQEVMALKSENEKMFFLIKELEKSNKKIAESVLKLHSSDQIFKVESFEVKFLSSNILCGSQNNLEEKVDNLQESISVKFKKKITNKRDKFKKIFEKIKVEKKYRVENSDSEENLDSLGTINIPGPMFI